MQNNRSDLLILILLIFSCPLLARPVETLLESRQNKVMMQKWDISCGAAALGTLLNYHFGDNVSEKDIARAMMTREEYIRNPEIIKMRLGFSLLDLKKFVESRGYEGLGLGRLTLDTLVERAPMIVPVYMHGYNHFVVFRGVFKNRVLLADPAWGNRTMTIDQFMDMWIDSEAMGRIGFQVRLDGDGVDEPEISGLFPRKREFVSLH
jgi:predicted double-glycine peptidase